jgi:dienelactone hydrolase
MIRRDFFKAGTLGALAGITGNAHAADSLPKNQYAPAPDLGTHWEFLSGLSERCAPQMSFLDAHFSDVETWADQARSYLRQCLHYDPAPVAFDAEVVEEVDRGDYTRRRVMLTTAPDCRIPAYVLVPKNLDGPAPAVVALHDHGGFYLWGKEKVVEVGDEHPELAAFKQTYYGGFSVADELAKRGYVVIAADMLHWGERGMYLDADPTRIRERSTDVTAEDVRAFNARSWAHEELVSRTVLASGATWSGIITHDDRRVADYLLSLPEVDADRVGCVGLSLGSVRSIFLGALHPKVRASVAVCWMAAYQQMTRNNVRNGIGFTKLVPGLYGQLDWPDLAGLHLPGALMTINGLQDQLYPLQAAQDAVAKAERIFAKAEQSGQYEGVFFDGPHEFNPDMQQRTFAWLDAHLK